jgi:hypothetical protein
MRQREINKLQAGRCRLGSDSADTTPEVSYENIVAFVTLHYRLRQQGGASEPWQYKSIPSSLSEQHGARDR